MDFLNFLCSGPCAVALAPVALGAIDFTPAGIAASSYAAGILPYAAIVKYEEVAAKSLVDVLQSAGIDFLSWTATKAGNLMDVLQSAGIFICLCCSQLYLNGLQFVY
uniref:Uncharacterized protein n=1 Tax=Amphiprion ocellaris TaxID=80972 RepID=A0A3Q1AL14_AMPOC